MKFKVNICKETKHTGVLCCVDWLKNDEVYSVGDDKVLYKWSADTRQATQVAKLPDDFEPTDLQWLYSSRSSSKSTGGSSTNNGNAATDSLLISSSDGRFIMLNRNARVERIVNAHQESVNAIRWSPDASGLLTAGEDGIIKIWSKLGMLRSTIVQNEESVRTACWSPNSMSIAYCTGQFIAIKPLAANSKLSKWKAHDGTVLCLSWANENNFLASGGDDRRYKVWDSQGSLIYSSSMENYSITSICFDPKGQFLAIGGFNMIKLCHFSGWSYSNTKFSEPSIGSVYNIRWSADGTQITAGSGTGQLLFAHVIEQEKSSKNLKAKTTGRKVIELRDVVNRTVDVIDFSQRIIKWEIGFGHLIVATVNQIHIYNEKYINTPLAIIEGRYDVKTLILGQKNFLVLDSTGISVYTYSGRLHLSPKFSGLNTQLYLLNDNFISIGLWSVAIRDCNDESSIHFFDLVPSAARQSEPLIYRTKTIVRQVAVSRSGTRSDQYLIFIDENRDIFCTALKNEDDFDTYKIGTQVLSAMWGSETNILVGLHDECYTIWYCPGEACMDPTVIALTTVTFELDQSELGKNIILENFEDSIITFKSAGTLYPIQASVFCGILHKLINDDQWQKALKLCRRIQDRVLWAVLAAISSKKNQLEICEEAYAAALQIDKVRYLQHMKSLPVNGHERIAEMSIANGRIVEAESILLHNNKVNEAIELCIRMHRWERALAIAESHKNDKNIDCVIERRRKFLKALNATEYLKSFLDKIEQ